MRQVRAKMLRRMVYGDNSIRSKTYRGLRGMGGLTIISTGLRREYQLAKREMKRLMREGKALWRTLK